MGCSVGRPMTPTCLPTARMGCPSTSPLALYTTMLQARCPSTPPLTCPPANPMPSCNPPPPRPCSVASPYPKPCPPTEMPRFKHDHCMVPVCCNGEPQKDCTKPPPLPASLTSCKSGQGNDFFSNMIRELNRNGVCSKFPPSKPVVTPCNPNTPTASTIGNMKIVEVSTNGHFVRILNISPNAEEDIGNYVLQQNIGGQPVAMYRFPPRTRVCVGSGVTVWAAGAKVPHNPPKDFLWKDCIKFATGPDVTTILCKPTGQAVTWYTPGPGSCKQNNLCNDDCNHHTSTNDCQVNFQLEPEMETDSSNACASQFTTLSIKEKASSLQPTPRCPWSQSTSCATHPDFNISRTQAMGNDGNSQCRDSRTQSSPPDPLPSNLPVSSHCRKYSFHRSTRRLSPCSLTNGAGQQIGNGAGSFTNHVQQNCTPLQLLQSRQNLTFQPPMPRPPPVASW
ncbi:uncharacterized protein LOC129708033 [Leucoraja erinacea]|uniref:uncharacterized protein LOC129708033 n=1 Tax=Leucoraja erinaceus TaxID=7782 RepID=UPI00245871E7|nr:uncharacterized protein LOC129708033 [Leucoraja erinacea]